MGFMVLEKRKELMGLALIIVVSWVRVRVRVRVRVLMGLALIIVVSWGINSRLLFITPINDSHKPNPNPNPNPNWICSSLP